MAVYKRGNSWEINFRIGGKRFRRTAGRGTSKAQAKELETKLKAQAQEEFFSGRLGKKLDRTFGEALAKWMQSDAPDSMIDHIVIVKARLQNIKLSKIIQEAHLFQEEMIKAGRKPATVNRRMAVVRRVLNLCYKKWDWIHEPLGQKISMLKENNQRHVYLTADEIENLAVLSPREDVGNFIRLAAYTGLRRGELLGLMPHNFIKGRIVLEANTKNRKPRVVPVPKHLHKYLKDLPIKLEKHHIKWHFDVARKAYGHPEWRLHDLRHTYGSFLAANPEIPVTVIRDLMGHSSLSVSSRYLHLRTKSLDDAVSKIPVPNKKSAKLSTKRSQNKKTKKKDDE